MSSKTQQPVALGRASFWRPDALRSRIVNASLILLAGSGFASLANLAYNIVVARMLGPAGFANATAVYTLIMLLSAVTLSFQIVCAKLVASHSRQEEKAAVYVALHRRAWRYGVVIGLLLVLARGAVSSYLNLGDTKLVLLLAVGTAFYIPLGARRGLIQGICAFPQLALNFALEGFLRLGGAYVLLRAGAGVTGAVAASVVGIVLAYIIAAPRAGLTRPEGVRIPVSFREGLQAIVFFTGQVIINNFDIILVKHFFQPSEAGLYAAIALVGRVVNMCAWSVANSMFPVAAGTPRKGDTGRGMLTTSLLLVLLIVLGLVLFLSLMPSVLWQGVFGGRFDLFGAEISSLLVLYAVTSGVYAFSSVTIAYEMSRKLVNVGWVQLGFAAGLIGAIYVFHRTLLQVIIVLLVVLLALLLTVLLPILRTGVVITDTRIRNTYGRVRKLRALTTDEVIAEFLKNDFPSPEFDGYRRECERLVYRPDLSSPEENALRKILLFVRQGALWRELPADARWYEVEIGPRDLPRVRAFPRAQWRKIAQGNFHITEIVERIRAELERRPDDEFFRKLLHLSALLPDGAVHPAILLIGINERSPLTVLDGNHRLTAALLTAPGAIKMRFRFICGFSPAMARCCWYQTNVLSLWRYAMNLVRYIAYDPESDLGRLMDNRT